MNHGPKNMLESLEANEFNRICELFSKDRLRALLMNAPPAPQGCKLNDVATSLCLNMSTNIRSRFDDNLTYTYAPSADDAENGDTKQGKDEMCGSWKPN